MKTHTQTHAKMMKTPSRQNGVFVVSAAFIAIGLGLVGIGVDSNINKDRTNYSIETSTNTQQILEKNETEDFFASFD